MATTFSAATTASTANVIRETLFEEGIPRIIAPDVYDYVFARGKQDGERVLVHRKIIAYRDQNYTIDYITSSSDEGWRYSTVAYRSQSPFPFTVDSRETISAFPSPPLRPSNGFASSGFSSSGFAAAAYAQCNAMIATASLTSSMQ